jgi:signal-transduction protein with cAMP-binding, CBS, and nucleotidyltransferase domain
VNNNSDMRVRDALSSDLLAVEPGESLHEAARRMAEREVGSAVVAELTRPWPGILTERDILHAIAAGKDPKLERVAAHETAKVVFAVPDWPLDRAAETMIEGGFRHLVVVEGRRPVGILSMRDIVRCWVENGAAPVSELSGTASEA